MNTIGEKAPASTEDAISVNRIEDATADRTLESGASNDAILALFTPEQQKRIIRRIDIRLVIPLGLLYSISLMDRTNLGNAVIAGMGVDLVLVGNRYSIIVLLFFITYVLGQPLATVLLRKIGPQVFLPSITVLWGLTMTCFGFVKGWQDLIALRLVLGVFEAGFFPGMMFR